MCTESKTLKLCTCTNKLDKSRPYWTLSRLHKHQAAYQPIIEGLFLLPTDYRNEKTTQWILTQLSKATCFDFNYVAVNEDKLMISIEDVRYIFVYCTQAKNWQEASQSALNNVPKRSAHKKGYAVFE